MTKSIAFLIALVFTSTSVVWSAPPVYTISVSDEYGTVTQRWKAPSLQKSEIRNQKSETAVLSSDLCPLTSESRPTVVLIQDAHTSFDAQVNIGKIVEQVLQNIQKSEITCPPHEQNSRGRRGSQKSEKTNLTSDLCHLSSVPFIGIEGATSEYDFSELKKFPFPSITDSVMQDYVREGTVLGAEYGAVIADDAVQIVGLEDQNAFRTDYRAFYDVASHQKEINEYITALTDGINTQKEEIFNPELAVFDHEVTLFETGEKSATDILPLLYEKLNERAIDLSPFIHFMQVKEALDTGRDDILEHIDGEGLMTELREMISALRMQYAETLEERKLIRANEYVRLLAQILTLNATRSEVQIFNTLHRTIDKSQWSMVNGQWSSIEPLLEKALQFYSVSESRDTILVDNLLTTMDERKQDIGILVAGGYHTDGIIEALKKKNISYLVVQPNLGTDLSNTTYMKKMMGDVVPIDQRIFTSFDTSHLIASVSELNPEYFKQLFKAIPNDMYGESLLQYEHIINAIEKVGVSHNEKTETYKIARAITAIRTELADIIGAIPYTKDDLAAYRQAIVRAYGDRLKKNDTLRELLGTVVQDEVALEDYLTRVSQAFESLTDNLRGAEDNLRGFQEPRRLGENNDLDHGAAMAAPADGSDEKSKKKRLKPMSIKEMLAQNKYPVYTKQEKEDALTFFTQLLQIHGRMNEEHYQVFEATKRAIVDYIRQPLEQQTHAEVLQVVINAIINSATKVLRNNTARLDGSTLMNIYLYLSFILPGDKVLRRYPDGSAELVSPETTKARGYGMWIAEGLMRKLMEKGEEGKRLLAQLMLEESQHFDRSEVIRHQPLALTGDPDNPDNFFEVIEHNNELRVLSDISHDFPDDFPYYKTLGDFTNIFQFIQESIDKDLLINVFEKTFTERFTRIKWTDDDIKRHGQALINKITTNMCVDIVRGEKTLLTYMDPIEKAPVYHAAEARRDISYREPLENSYTVDPLIDEIITPYHVQMKDHRLPQRKDNSGLALLKKELYKLIHQDMPNKCLHIFKLMIGAHTLKESQVILFDIMKKHIEKLVKEYGSQQKPEVKDSFIDSLRRAIMMHADNLLNIRDIIQELSEELKIPLEVPYEEKPGKRYSISAMLYQNLDNKDVLRITRDGKIYVPDRIGTNDPLPQEYYETLELENMISFIKNTQDQTLLSRMFDEHIKKRFEKIGWSDDRITQYKHDLINTLSADDMSLYLVRNSALMCRGHIVIHAGRADDKVPFDRLWLGEYVVRFLASGKRPRAFDFLTEEMSNEEFFALTLLEEGQHLLGRDWPHKPITEYVHDHADTKDEETPPFIAHTQDWMDVLHFLALDIDAVIKPERLNWTVSRFENPPTDPHGAPRHQINPDEQNDDNRRGAKDNRRGSQEQNDDNLRGSPEPRRFDTGTSADDDLDHGSAMAGTIETPKPDTLEEILAALLGKSTDDELRAEVANLANLRGWSDEAAPGKPRRLFRPVCVIADSFEEYEYERMAFTARHKNIDAFHAADYMQQKNDFIIYISTEGDDIPQQFLPHLVLSLNRNPHDIERESALVHFEYVFDSLLARMANVTTLRNWQSEIIYIYQILPNVYTISKDIQNKIAEAVTFLKTNYVIRTAA